MKILHVVVEVENRIGDELSGSVMCDLCVSSKWDANLSSPLDAIECVFVVILVEQDVALISSSAESVSRT